MGDEAAGLDTWAMVELMGHGFIAGRVTEEAHAGVVLLRVEVPGVAGSAPFTRFFGGGAIFSLTPTDEATALQALAYHKPQPVSVYLPPPARQATEQERIIEAAPGSSDDPAESF